MLKLLSICLLIIVGVASQNADQLENNELIEQFEQFVKQYNKEYEDEQEKAIRFGHFVKNLQVAEELNQLYSASDAVFGLTKFSDWSEEEFKRMNGYTPQMKTDGYTPQMKTDASSLVPLQKYNTGPAPDFYDWRQQAAVTSVKQQGQCGSCWAFSAVGNIEGQYALKHNKVISLSEMQLVDCSQSNNACSGGLPYLAMEDLITSGELLESYADYPYQDSPNGECEYNKDKGVAKVIGYNFINATSEEELKQALFEYGPLSFAMSASTLQNYQGGILPGCGNDIAKDHALVMIGYGENDTASYWIVKNSWGEDWGEDGYFRLARGQDPCDLLEEDNFVSSQVA